MIIRAIKAKWETSNLPPVVEGQFSPEKIEELNTHGYNIYYLANYPSTYNPSSFVAGDQIDTFNYVFVDFDLKSETYTSKEAFLLRVIEFTPSKIVDSGNGIHAYWKVTDLDAMSYLRIQRRLMRLLKTDEAVGQIYQLLRVPGTLNVKNADDFKLCELLDENDKVYTCEELDAILPPITHNDEQYCQQHYNKTYKLAEPTKIDDRLPHKFAVLLKSNNEVKDIWQGNTDDRSKADYRLGHIMFAHSFTKVEALSVLVNAPKALERGPSHRGSYAEAIVEKIWTYEIDGGPTPEPLSYSVRELLAKGEGSIKGTRFPCDRLIDATHHGFRLCQVIGLVAGSGVGKTAMALNMFRWFVRNNPNHEHFFVPLEQPANEIADRWRTMAGDETHLHDKVHVISNYTADGSFRHLTFKEIEDYIVEFQVKTGKKVGCVVIDHIGALKKTGKDGENQDLMTICHEMKAFAIRTNTLVVMQSQSSREKAGIGDLELSKDAAYGTVYFESYCDYLITIWQPLKRMYKDPKCPTVTAYKFCKIRHKKQGLDEIKEDVPYRLFFDPATEHMRALTELEEKSFDFFNRNATNARKRDRKTDILEYNSTKWIKEVVKDDSKI